jgi:centromere protein C
MERRQSPRRAKPGTRTNVDLDVPIEESNPDRWFDSARSPDQVEGPKKDSKLPAKTPGRKKTRTPKQRVSMGLPGAKGDDDVDDGDESSSVSTEGKYVKKINKTKTRTDILMSPSNLSRVSTAAPSPRTEEKLSEEDQFPAEDGSDDDNDEIEKPLYTQEGDEEAANDQEEAAISHQAAAKTSNEKPDLTSPTDDFYAGNQDDDDDDELGNDLCPPAHDSSSEDEEEKVNDNDDAAKKSGNDIDGLESDNEKEDDHDGLGFNMVHDPETPEAIRAQHAREEKEKLKRQKKTKKSSDEDSENDQTEEGSKVTPKLKKGKKHKNKNKRHVTFSPKGIPAGPRSYDFVPIGALVENSPEEDGPRRSKRARLKPLEYWRGEKVEFGAHNEEGEIADAFGNMPVVKGIQKALPTPYKKRKQPPTNNSGKKKGGRKSTGSKGGGSVQEEEEFDSRKLRRKYKFLDGEKAFLWHDVEDDTEDLSKCCVIIMLDNLTRPLGSYLIICFLMCFCFSIVLFGIR